MVDMAESWFQSYWCGRTQSFIYAGQQTSSFRVYCSVLDRSVLGPLEFTAYTEDITDLWSNSTSRTCCTISCTTPPTDTLQQFYNLLYNNLFVAGQPPTNKLYNKFCHIPTSWHVKMLGSGLATNEQVAQLVRVVEFSCQQVVQQLEVPSNGNTSFHHVTTKIGPCRPRTGCSNFTMHVYAYLENITYLTLKLLII